MVKLSAGALAALAAGVTALSVLVCVVEPDPARLPFCPTTGPIEGLSAVQAENARTVASVASGRAGRPAALIAMVVALAESDLRVLGNPSVTGVVHPGGQGTGSDHDSVGLFQQRAGWGTAADRMDPVTSTNTFIDKLLALDGWSNLPPSVAAQRVQRSAFDGRPTAANHGSGVVGGNYLAQLSRAEHIVDAIGSTSSTDLCVGIDNGTSAAASAAPRHGLPADYAVPATASMAARVAVTYALSQRGKPYLWGATGPEHFDCSGLTQSAWALAGRRLGRTTWDQMRDGTPTSLTALRPGDLVLIPGSAGSLASPAHMGMFIGDELVVHAPRTGDVVKVTPLSAFASGGISALRHIA